MLNVFLSLDRCKHPVVPLIINEELDVVSLRKAVYQALAVFMDARLARQNVNSKVLHRGEAVWIAGSSPAMTAENLAAFNQ
jgi:hypothetical protein